MDRYIEFNAVKFIKESRLWEAEKKRLEAKLDGITEIKGIDNSPIRSGRLHDSVADVAAERERIERQIERIEQYQYAFKLAWEELNSDERTVIDLFFFDGGNIGKNVKCTARQLGIRERGIYEIRRNAIGKVKKFVDENFL